MKTSILLHRWAFWPCCLILFLLGCSSQAPEQTRPAPAALPAFLPWVYPAPASEVSYQEFREGYSIRGTGGTADAICVQLAAEEVLEEEDDGFELADYLERSQLVVNGNIVKQEATPHADFLGLLQEERTDEASGERTIIRSNATGPFIFCWRVPLEAGWHTAEFRISTSSGRQFSYQWEFRILD